MQKPCYMETWPDHLKKTNKSSMPFTPICQERSASKYSYNYMHVIYTLRKRAYSNI